MKFRIIIICLLIFLLAPSEIFAKKQKIDEPTGPLGSNLLLIGTSSALTIESLLKGVESFGKSVEHLSPDERNFLFGYANYRLGKLKDADAFFKRCKEEILADHILFYRARIALGLKENNKAEEMLSQLSSEYPQSVWANEAKRYQAEAKINSNHFEEGRGLIEQYMKVASTPGDKFEATLLSARSYVAEGRADEATIIFKNMVASVASEDELADITEAAPKSVKTWMQTPSVQYDIAESLMEHSQWQDALDHLEGALASKSLDSEFRFKWLYARCLFRAHLYKEAIPILEGLLESNGDGRQRLSILQNLASAYARVDDYERSIALQREIIREYPHSPSVVANSQLKIAFLLLDDGRYEDAISAFKRSRARTQALWYLAWSYYKLGDYDAAVRMMNDVLQKGGKKAKIEDRIKYWKARSFENAGQKNDARALYKEIATNHPVGYYGFLSRRRLGEPLQKWPKGKFSVVVPKAETIADTSPHLARAIILDKLDLHEEAVKEISASLGTEKEVEINLIMWLAGKNFAHNISYTLAYQRYSSILSSMPLSDGFERFVWEQSYPEAYKPVVERLVGHSFDPKIVYSIMRSESNFRPRVVSPAGAIGLMQLMPLTAKKVAAEYGDKDFDAHDLYRPVKNIEYGIRYLKKLYALFPDDSVAVAAAYNAGEEAVSRWLRHGYSSDAEEFIEEIPYEETNLYVKKVLTAYWILEQMHSK